MADMITKMTELTVAKHKMTEQCCKMVEHCSKRWAEYYSNEE
jgi:hypothetical protein